MLTEAIQYLNPTQGLITQQDQHMDHTITREIQIQSRLSSKPF